MKGLFGFGKKKEDKDKTHAEPAPAAPAPEAQAPEAQAAETPALAPETQASPAPAVETPAPEMQTTPAPSAETSAAPPVPPKKYLVQYDRKGCIGAGACEAVNPEYWKVNEDRKAQLNGSTLNAQSQMFELTIEEKDLEKMRAAADGCPKNVIHIINSETGEKLI